ncbi:MAG: electron transfer flavoprotein subunit alpha [Candidatus Rokubacteria bacterium 13_1_40CM_69_27]|nr:MAG: electron transfer flavoprotein subunit alpha [Candidatus Rokubacteria bacterium 13_1_40CM_69_27]OLE39415.1 MAG: electron transfer flavoprotein subunit alpha [Candidatus Rokubacteria bacterium 13_1_20CM_2_70_7]
MNIVVCAKVVPLSSVTIQIDPATKRMVRKDVSQELDPQAAKAVEEALRLTEKQGGSVTVVVMGGDDATIGIRGALAMGATAAIHLSDPALAGSDALGTAKALAAAIRKEPFDLVICATESSDSYTGLVPGQLAQLLGVPPLTFATSLTVEGRTVTIKRQSEGGYDVVTSELPVLVTVTTGINEPRYPTLKGIMGAKKKEIRKYTAADLGLGPAEIGESGAREKVLTVGRPPARPAGTVIKDEGQGGKQIADFLANLKLI